MDKIKWIAKMLIIALRIIVLVLTIFCMFTAISCFWDGTAMWQLQIAIAICLSILRVGLLKF